MKKVVVVVFLFISLCTFSQNWKNNIEEAKTDESEEEDSNKNKGAKTVSFN